MIDFPSRRVDTPTVLQMEAVECGAAALAMVLEYHGKYIPLERLRIACGISRDGSKASNMLKAARSLGMIAKGFKKEPEALLEMQLPVIVFWNFNHYIVVEGFNKKGEVFVNDPAFGKKVLSWEEFDEGFTGVVLTFEKTDEFQADSKRPSIYPGLLRRLKGLGSPLAIVVIVGVLMSVPGLMIPVFSKIFIDNYLIQGMKDWVLPLIYIMIATLIVNAGLHAVQQYYLLKMHSSIALRESSKFFWHIIRLPMNFFTQRMAGEISSRVSLNNNIATVISGHLAVNIIGVINIVFYAALMFYYDVTLTLIGIFFVVANFIIFKKIIKTMTLRSQKIALAEGKLLGVSMGGLQSIETLKASANEDDFFNKWSGYQAKLQNSRNEMVMLNQAVSITPALFTSLNVAIVLVIGSFRVMDGYLTMGMLVAFQSLMHSFSAPVNGLLSLSATIKDLEGDMTRIDDVLKHPIQEQDKVKFDTIKDEAKLKGFVELRNISFGYSKLSEPLIKDFNLSVKPGERVAIIGASGSGKSTVAKILTGLYKAWDGDIFVDGKNILEIDPRVRTNSIAMVTQDITIFKGTIKDNITLWDNSVPDEEVIRACKDACIHDHIASLPDGYNTIMDEAGRNFSGGQKQRIEIARAFLSNPSILILDEATSALDPITEMQIDESIRRRGCTTIIIAHRLSTIRDSDNIVVLKWGKIIQEGTHEELKSVDGLYAELIRMSQ